MARNDTDTLIFGYSWQDIQDMQQRRYVPKRIVARPKATHDDLAMLDKYGMDELKRMGYWGVIDRLQST